MKTIAIAGLLLWTLGVAAQDKTLAFEVASVKANRTEDGSWRVGCGGEAGPQSGISPGTCRTVTAPLRMIVALAYDIPVFTASQQISELPGWTTTERYDIEGKAENPSVTSAQLRMMLQNLLADRFKLKLHEVTKEVSGYALVVAKGGFKDRPLPSSGGIPLACGSPTAVGLARCLSSRLSQPVVDETGITERHNFSLTVESLAEDQPSAPSIFTVLEEQLGLKLEPRKVLSKTLVIDHVEKPSEN